MRKGTPIGLDLRLNAPPFDLAHNSQPAESTTRSSIQEAYASPFASARPASHRRRKTAMNKLDASRSPVTEPFVAIVATALF